MTVVYFKNYQPLPEVQRALARHQRSTIYIVEDDEAVRHSLRELFEHEGPMVQDFSDSEAFLDSFDPEKTACLVIDANLPGISGLDLLDHLKETRQLLPAIMISGCGSINVAVRAMKAGAIDFIEKPARCADLIASIDRALSLSHEAKIKLDRHAQAEAHLGRLTPRQHQVMQLVLAGQPSKNIAADLKISQRTVENHRASIMKKTCTTSLPALARLANLAAGPVLNA